MPIYEYRTTFYKLSTDGLDGNATHIGLEILKPHKVLWKGETWAITEPVTQILDGIKITSAKLSRSRETEINELAASSNSLHLEQHTVGTNDFVPISFFQDAHVFAIPSRPRFSTRKVVRALRGLAPTFIGELVFYPLLEERSLRDRLKQYAVIHELSFNILRANPESPEDARLLNEELGDSHIKRYFLRLIGDPRGLNIETIFVNNQLAYVEAGLGALTGGKATNEAGLQEIISGKDDAPKAITIQSSGDPADFAEKLAQNSPIASERMKQLEAGE